MPTKHHKRNKIKSKIKKLGKIIYKILTLEYIDDLIEKWMLHRLHKKKGKFVNQVLEEFKKRHPDIEDDKVDTLHKKLLQEVDRIYDIIDKSVLHAGIKRAKLVLLATLVITVVVIAVTAIASSGGSALLLLPLLAPLAAWVVTLFTIPISYNERIVGGLNAVVHAYERELSNMKDNNVTNTFNIERDSNLKVENSKTQNISSTNKILLKHFPVEKQYENNKRSEPNKVSGSSNFTYSPATLKKNEEEELNSREVNNFSFSP